MIPFHKHPDQCDNPEEHDPSSYKALVIYDGVLEGKALDIQIIFPIGSKWEVRSKVLMDVEFSGTLLTDVVYKELNWKLSSKDIIWAHGKPKKAKKWRAKLP